MSSSKEANNSLSSHSNSGNTSNTGRSSKREEEETELLTRRRDKRRHLSSAALDLRHPRQVLELAVRFDEGRQDEAILREPLENGKLYDQKQFLEALKFLESQTRPPTTLEKQQQQSSSTSSLPSPSLQTQPPPAPRQSPLSFFSELSRKVLGFPTPPRQTTQGGYYPDHALTPIILSGLLGAVRDNDAAAASEGSTSMDPVSELVLACQSLRRAAWRRLQRRRTRRRVQRRILPAASLCLLSLLYGQWVREIWQSLVALQFAESDEMSCEIYLEPKYERACQLAEAHLWTMFEDYLLLDKCRNDNDDGEDNCLKRKFGAAPLALQARFSRNLIPIEDVLDESTATPRDMFHLGKIPRSEPALDQMVISDTTGHKSKWLGNSVPMLTMGKPFEHTDLDDFQEISVLDVGCGVGTALYYLLPTETAKFNYHGITVSHAEVHFAREMVRRQGLGKERIFFEQRSFDEILPRNYYNLVVALESLAFSPELEDTMANLMSVLQPGGALVVADEFVLPRHKASVSTMAAARRAPSFHTISTYTTMMEYYGCRVKYVHEYGLELQYEGYPTWVHQEDVSLWGWLFYPWLPGRARRLYQLRKDQGDLYRAFRQKKADAKADRTTYALIKCVKPDE